jgi:ribosomal protein S18 acetylase RimI-like enzyme
LSGIELRPCRFQDLGQVEIIERNSFSYRPYSRTDFTWFLSRAQVTFLVTCANDSPVGYVIALGQPRGDGVIQSIAVLPEFRGRSIGQELMKAAMQRLSACKRVELLVEVGNESAISLYRKFAFRETGRVIKRYYGEKDALELAWEEGSGRQKDC